MMTSLVLTVIGPDRTGLVDSLSETLAAHGGNWEESRMTRLAGQFAGILLASVPVAKADALTRNLQELESEGLRVVVQRTLKEPPAAAHRILHLELVGQDHPGIVHDISHVLAARRINIDELTTHCSSASMSGETLFHANAQLSVPQEMATDELKAVLEGLANELMVDITLEDQPAQ